MASDRKLTRRELLRTGSVAGTALWLAGNAASGRSLATAPSGLETADDKFLDDVERASFEFYWQEANPSTGQVKDRALLNGNDSGNDSRPMSSIASTGFGLTALCIADQRGYRKRNEILDRVRTTLRFLWQRMPQEH